MRRVRDEEKTRSIDHRRMQGAEEQRTGILIIRVWSEGRRATRLRIRITRTDHIGRSNETSTSTDSIDDASATVRGWLERFARSTRDSPDAVP
jgi:hypothetical protein